MRELPEQKGVLLEEPEYLGPHVLCRAGCTRFPALGEALLDERESVHGQLAIFAREVDAAVAAQDVSRAIQPFLFLEEVLKESRVHSEIESAVAISFIVPQVLRESSTGTQILAEVARAAPRVHAILLAQEEHEHRR